MNPEPPHDQDDQAASTKAGPNEFLREREILHPEKNALIDKGMAEAEARTPAHLATEAHGISESSMPIEGSKPVAARKPASVARSAGIVSMAVMTSRVLGLVREMVFAYFFGASKSFANDAYVIAFRIPNLLRDLFAEGALSSAFVTVFSDYLVTKDEKEAFR
ncbi:MAG: lipid II flippase MurJ, partial [Blastocatellia bacterium]